MSIFLRIWLAFAVVLVAGGWFTINTLQEEIRPSVRQAIEDTLADNANLIAGLVVEDLKSGRLQTPAFDRRIRVMLARPLQARIWGIEKTAVSQQIYITDAHGFVLYDSAGLATGKDYSHWNDIRRTLEGRYGARTTRRTPDDESTSTMFVAAPVLDEGKLIGVVSLGKPSATVQPFIDRARRQMLVQGLWVVALSLALSGGVAWWLRHAIHRVARYARSLGAGESRSLHFFAARELNELVEAIDRMRRDLEDKAYVENYVLTLTHELKSPLTAIQASAELLQEELPEADRQRFAISVREQADRLQQLAERLLMLTRLEKRTEPFTLEPTPLRAAAEVWLRHHEPRLQRKRIRVELDVPEPVRVRAEAFWLEQALANILDNALDFLPEGGSLSLRWSESGGDRRLDIRNDGPTVPDYALVRVFERFYSLPSPTSGRKGSGIGLTLVTEVMSRLGGRAVLTNDPAGGGVTVSLHFP